MLREGVIAVVVAVVVVATVAAVILLQPGAPTPSGTTTTTAPSGGEISIAEFDEFQESFVYINANGDARCSLVAQLPPSQISSFMKQLTTLTGMDVIKQSYEESIRESQARCGF